MATLLLLAGCRNTTFMKPPINDPSDDATIKLAEAASSVSDSMMEMAKVEKVITPPTKDNTLTIPNAYNLQARASVDWSGPIEELTARIAKAGNFRLRVLGKSPSLPILISLNIRDESLAEILRNIDYQAGTRAYLHVYPNSQVVELRYAKIYS
ncbi:type IVB secretion system lipoprotein DotD [Legionella sp. CNM-4043-24]|uniref:type IVB secretion system lipoprotein DotD n=1 Tax=Legionella sp. CNM-4043-24 TaxID=3421646 RepID=UPI00403A9D04